MNTHDKVYIFEYDEGIGWWETPGTSDAVEYVRADLYEQLQQENTRLKDRLSAVMSNHGDLWDTIDKREERIANQRKELARLQQENAGLKRRIGTLHDVAIKLGKGSSELKAQLQQRGDV